MTSHSLYHSLFQAPGWPVTVLRSWRGAWFEVRGLRARGTWGTWGTPKVRCPQVSLITPDHVTKSLVHTRCLVGQSLCCSRGGHITRLVAINRTESTTEARNTALRTPGRRLAPGWSMRQTPSSWPSSWFPSVQPLLGRHSGSLTTLRKDLPLSQRWGPRA